MEQSYTTSYSTNEDRFGFVRKGTFKCRLRNEKLVLFIIIGISFIIESLEIFSSLSKSLLGNSLSGVLFDYIIFIGIFVIPVACITAIRIARSGEEYRFTATEEKMLITCAKHDIRDDIYYDNVASVEYSNIFSATGKIRGYNVVISCRDGFRFSYDFLFRENMQIRSKDMTPFVIIEERAGLLDKPEFFAGRRVDAVNDYRR